MLYFHVLSVGFFCCLCFNRLLAVVWSYTLRLLLICSTISKSIDFKKLQFFSPIHSFICYIKSSFNSFLEFLYLNIDSIWKILYFLIEKTLSTGSGLHTSTRVEKERMIRKRMDNTTRENCARKKY